MSERKIDLIRRLPNGNTFFYRNIEIVRQTDEFIEFIDTKTNKLIRLPSNDFQLEIENGVKA